MQQAVEDAVTAMHWLKDSDGAVVALAVRYAAEIDKAGDDQRAVGYLGQQLMGALRSLGGMPVERKALGVEEAVGDRLAELGSRSERRRRAASVDAAAAGVDA
jgi:hypothetical protein